MALTVRETASIQHTLRDIPLLAVQPSRAYFEDILRVAPRAVALATESRARQLDGLPAHAVDFDDMPACERTVRRLERAQGRRFEGIATYVCEFMLETARLAGRLQLPFHSDDAVAQTRYKHLGKQAWQAAGVLTPAGEAVRSADEAADVVTRLPGAAWICKPVSASGSEGVLKVTSPAQAADAARTILRMMRDRAARRDPSAQPYQYRGTRIDPASVVLVEAFIQGEEGSADVFIDGDRTEVLRLTRKWMSAQSHGSGGVALGYRNAAFSDLQRRRFTDAVGAALRALGVARGICMVDFIVTRTGFCFLEAALRPGGDCLPAWSRYVSGYDPIEETLRVSVGLTPRVLSDDAARPSGASVRREKPARQARQTRQAGAAARSRTRERSAVAFHLLAPGEGRLSRADWDRLRAMKTVQSVEPYRQAGEDVRLSSGGYQDLILGSVVTSCERKESIRSLYRRLYNAGAFQVTPSEFTEGAE